jgi:hypothetical protein
MNDTYSKWSDVLARGHAVDQCPAAEQAVGKAVARERHEAYILKAVATFRSKFKAFSPERTEATLFPP